MKKRPLLILSGTVMGTVGVLSFVPMATNALAPLGTSSSTFGAGAQVSAPVAATTSKNPSRTSNQVKSVKKKHTSTRATTSTTGSTATTASTAMRTIAGSTSQTPFGPLQVQITVKGKKIIGATALQAPQGGRSSMINQQAIPYLVQETLAAQSANIQGVSGATYTSDGWAQSLQSALSKI